MAVQRACQPTYTLYILEGRKRVAEMPREWVLENIEQIGRESLDLTEYWEYGRFLEVLDLIGAHELVRQLVREGLESAEFDVRDMAEMWANRRGTAVG